MGLDAVELVMAVEDEFGIVISDKEAEKIQTVGQLYDYVREAVKIKMRPPPSDIEIWTRITPIIADQLGVEPHRITKEAHFIRDLGME